jgi:hypothetical protein
METQKKFSLTPPDAPGGAWILEVAHLRAPYRVLVEFHEQGGKNTFWVLGKRELPEWLHKEASQLLMELGYKPHLMN